MIQQFGYRTGSLAIYDKWLRSLPNVADLASQACKALLNQQPELRNLPAFQFTPSGERINVSTSLLAKRFANVPRQKLSQALQQFERDQTKLVTANLNTLVEEQVPTAGDLIRNWVEPLLNQAGGLELTHQALTELAAHFERHFHRLTQQIERKREAYRQWEEQRQRQRRPWWGRLTFQPRQAFVQYWQRRLQFQIDELRLATQLGYVQQVQRLIADLVQTVDSWQVTLKRMVTRLEDEKQAFLRDQAANQSVVIEPVLNDQDIEQLYAADREAAQQQAADGLCLAFRENDLKLLYRYIPVDSQNSMSEASADGRTLLSPEGIAQHLAYARQFWFHLRDLDIEQILADQGRTGAELLEQLTVKSAPLIAADEVLHIPAEQRLIVLGSEHGSTGLFRDAEPGPSVNLVATGDKHRIACLSTVHGINALQLRQTPAWKQAYDEAMAQGRLLHVIPEFDPTAREALVEDEEVADVSS